MTLKEKARQIVDTLNKDELQAALRFLEYLRDQGVDPVLRALENAPEDDEPETEEEAAAVREARAAIARGEVVSNEQLRQELKL